LDDEKSEAEKALRDGEPMRIKWTKELKALEDEISNFSNVYADSKEGLERIKADHVRKRQIVSQMRMDHMSLISAEDLRKNPPKTYSAKADKEKMEALVNFARSFNASIANASNVVDYHNSMREIADQSRVRREQLLLQAKEEEDLTKEQFLQKTMRALLGLDHDLEPGTTEFRWALNNIRRKKHLNNQKQRSMARKANRDRKRRAKLLRQAEVMPVADILFDLKAFGIEGVEDEFEVDR